MADAMHGAFSPVEARKLVRLLKEAGQGALRVRTEADEQLLSRAVSAGLVQRRADTFLPRPEASNYLRRLFTADGETDFAAQHGERAKVNLAGPEGSRIVLRNLDESPLAHLVRLRGRDGQLFLPEDAIAAGERLLSDFTRGQLQPRITAGWEPRLSERGKGSAGGQADLKDAALSARHRFSRAVEAMGPELAGVALDVCCFYKGLETVERERQWPARSAKLLLRAALMTLARHYAPPPVRNRMRNWHEAGGRP